MKMIVLFIIISIAAVTDILTFKVKNIIIIFGIISGLYFQFIDYGMKGILNAAAGIVLSILCLWLLFCFHALGAGDIKLLSVVGCFVGPLLVLECILYAILIGGVMSLGKMLYEGNLVQRYRYFIQYLRKVVRNRCYEPYQDGTHQKREYGIHFSIAVLISVIICWEGIC